MKENVICGVAGCSGKAKFSLYRFNRDGSKTWTHVCDMHERNIGDSNMRRAGGRYEPKEGSK